ncbi:MAG: hypothetical protein E6I32_16095, partial [Chloroflexi bacterium]
MGNIAFYPGIGNHEFHAESREDTVHTAAEFSAAWDMPVRYAWTAGEGSEVVCIMLDQPDPYKPDPLRENIHVIFSQETLAFLDAALAEHAKSIAIIFAH